MFECLHSYRETSVGVRGGLCQHVMELKVIPACVCVHVFMCMYRLGLNLCQEQFGD